MNYIVSRVLGGSQKGSLGAVRVVAVDPGGLVSWRWRRLMIRRGWGERETRERALSVAIYSFQRSYHRKRKKIFCSSGMNVGRSRGFGPHKGSLLSHRQVVKGLLLLGIMDVVFFCLYIPLLLVFPKPLGGFAKVTKHAGTEGQHVQAQALPRPAIVVKSAASATSEAANITSVMDEGPAAAVDNHSELLAGGSGSAAGAAETEGVHSREKRAALLSSLTKPKPAYEGRDVCGPTYPDEIFPTDLDSYFKESSSGNIGIKAVDNPALEDDYILPNKKTVAQNRKHHVEICRQYLGQTWSDISKKSSKYELWQHGFSQSGQDKWLWDEAMLTSTKVLALLVQKYKY